MRTADRYDREDARRAFEAIAKDTIANGGGTYRRETGAKVPLTTGYTVGVGNVGVFGYTPGRTDRTTVAESLALRWPTTAPANAQYVGTWIDSEASLLFIDHVTVINDLAIALALARRNDEQSIYDNARGVCIYVDDVDDEDVSPVFVADAPADAVVWAKGEPFCQHCGASLIDMGSVRYFEQYAGRFALSPYGECVAYASYTVDQTAYCAKCGGPLTFEDVHAMS